MHLLSDTAQVALFIFMILFSLIAVGVLGAIAFALIKVNKQLDKITGMAEPVIIKASDTLDTVQRITVSVGEKADHILTRGETLTENVSGNVERTASVVHRTVTTPLINLSSWVTGISKGFSVWGREAAHGNGNAQARNAKTYTEE